MLTHLHIDLSKWGENYLEHLNLLSTKEAHCSVASSIPNLECLIVNDKVESGVISGLFSEACDNLTNLEFALVQS